MTISTRRRQSLSVLQFRLLLCLCLAMLPHLAAQRGAQTHLLPPEQLHIAQQLEELSHLPDGDWKAHVGVLSHGEALQLDDSAWETAHLRASGPLDAMWYRRWIEVPRDLHGYDLTGARITLKLNTAPNIMTVTVYLNGRRAAMGEDMEAIPLFEHARPGEKVLIAIKMSKTATPKSFSSAALHVEPVEGRPSPEDLHDECIAAATLIPKLSMSPAAELESLQKVLGAVDLKALGDGDQHRFDSSLRAASAELQPLRKVLASASLLLDGQSHIDAAYRWPWTEAVDVVHRTFSTALQLMDEYPDYKFTQSSTIFNEWMADKYPILDNEIKERVREGRWELVGGMWVEGDFNLPGGESQVRQLLLGKRYLRQHYGVDVRVGWNPDSFGFNWQLPQIYKKSGVDFFVTHKMAWNETNKLPLSLFWWQAPDGSKVLAYFPPEFASTNLNITRLANAYSTASSEAPGLHEVLDLYGVGDHGGGPTRDVLDEGMHWMDAAKTAPTMRFATALDFFKEAQTKISARSPVWNYGSMAEGHTTLPEPPAGQITIPTWSDELYLEYHRGTYTTQTEEKRNLRRGEEAMLNAEETASLAWLKGNAYPQGQLNEAWKKVLFNGFHDLAAGSGVGTIYRDAAKDFEDVQQSTDEIEEGALKTLFRSVKTRFGQDEAAVAVFNPLSWGRTSPVEVLVQMPGAAGDAVSVLDDLGQVVPSEVLSHDAKTHSYRMLILARDVPSVGYRILRVTPRRREFPSDLKVHGLTLENAKLRVAVDVKTGCISSLYDKTTGFETLVAGSCGNALMAFHDEPKAWDAWNIDADFEKISYKMAMPDSVSVVEQTPLRAVIRITRSWQHSRFAQQIVLYAGADTVDVVNDVDWHEDHVLLKSAFQLTVENRVATFEIPFGAIDRPTTRKNSWDSAKFEVPAQRWADLSDGRHGMSLLNESKFGYDAKGNMLRLTLLRSPLAPDPDADRGANHFSFAIYPHAGDWKQALTVRRGYEYNNRLQAMQVNPHDGYLPAVKSFVSTDAKGVVMTALKKAEDSNGLIFRFYDWAGVQADVAWQVPEGASSARLVNMMEQPQSEALPVSSQGVVTVPVHPFEIQTFRVDYPDGAHGSVIQKREGLGRKAAAEPDGQVDR